ncbi:hypothetical protein AYL59_10730 [Salmonella enterica]|nr:hypothetical protein [Salmonella enterica]
MKPTYEELEKKCALQQSKLAAINELMGVVEKASDIAKAGIEELQSQNADLAVHLANAESKCRDLAAVVAENAGLKNFIINDCHVAHIEPETFYEEEVTRYVSADGYEPETPATDAFLAEVRAQGVDASIEHLSKKFEGTGHIGVPVMALEWLAQEIRKGAAQ